MKIQNNQFLSIEQLQDRYLTGNGRQVQNRNIELTKDQVERLNLGAAKAGAKGIHESLVIVDSFAFIVNVPNNTVITAISQAETNDSVFTNIDGAVII